LRPIAAIALPAVVAPGTLVSLNGSGSAAACNANIASYQWTVIAPATNPPLISNPSGALARELHGHAHGHRRGGPQRRRTGDRDLDARFLRRPRRSQ
jgi:hypothetical protein